VAEPGGRRGAVKLVAQRPLGQPLAVVGEQELCGPAGARVRDRPSRRAGGRDPVDQHQRLLIQRHHPLGFELAQRHLQP